MVYFFPMRTLPTLHQMCVLISRQCSQIFCGFSCTAHSLRRMALALAKMHLPTNNSDLKHKVNFLQDNPVAAENIIFEDKNRARCKLESQYLTDYNWPFSSLFNKRCNSFWVCKSKNLKLHDWVDHKLR